jgi:predicted transcriptional regulator
MHNYLAIISPMWRDETVIRLLGLAISPKSRQNGEIQESNIKKVSKITYEGTTEGITEGVIEGITEGVKESMVEIVSVILTEQSIRASEIAEKLNKSYKTLERHISSLKKLNAIEYKGSKRAGGYEVTEKFSTLLKIK